MSDDNVVRTPRRGVNNQHHHQQQQQQQQQQQRKSRDPFFKSLAALRGMIKQSISGTGGNGDSSSSNNSRSKINRNDDEDDNAIVTQIHHHHEQQSDSADVIIIDRLKKELEEARDEAAKERAMRFPLERALEDLGGPKFQKDYGPNSLAAVKEDLEHTVEEKNLLKVELDKANLTIEELRKEIAEHLQKLDDSSDTQQTLESKLDEAVSELVETQGLLKTACEQQGGNEYSNESEHVTALQEQVDALQKDLDDVEEQLEQTKKQGSKKDELVSLLKNKVQRLEMSEGSLQREIRRYKKVEADLKAELDGVTKHLKETRVENQEVISSLQDALGSAHQERQLARQAHNNTNDEQQKNTAEEEAKVGGCPYSSSSRMNKKRGRELGSEQYHVEDDGDDDDDSDNDTDDDDDDDDDDEVEIVDGPPDSKKPRGSSSSSSPAPSDGRNSALSYDQKFHI